MIDEKKLIEEIKSLTVFVTGLRAGKGVLSEFAKHYKESVLRIIDEQPKADWIPCEERLPDKRGNYLVCSKGVTWVANWFLNTWWELKKGADIRM